jgi:hypothetical protein
MGIGNLQRCATTAESTDHLPAEEAITIELYFILVPAIIFHSYFFAWVNFH